MNGESRLKDRIPPHSDEAEIATLGALLLNPEALATVLRYLRPDDFYKTVHQRIFEVIIYLFDHNEAIDLITVTERLKAGGLLDSIGGAAYVSRLTSSVPTSANVEYYARIVQACSMRRTLVRIASGLVSNAHDESQEARVIIEDAERQIFEITDRQLSGSFKPAKEIVAKTIEAIEKLYHNKGAYIGVPTGFPDLDDLTSGFQNSEFIVIGARPSVGKTALAVTMAANMAIKHKIPVGFFTLEMSSMALMQRLLSAEARLPSTRLRSGFLRPADFHKLTEAAARIYEAPMYIEDTPSLKLLDLRAQARRMRHQFQVAIIFIDYLTLISSENLELPRHEQIAEISRSLKALARELNIPIVALSQVRRESEGKQPNLADLRESGCLAGDTLVTMADTGRRVPIRDLVGKSGFKVWALNEETLKIEAAEASAAFATGRKPVYKLVTRLGRTIRATGNHRFRGFEGWKRLDELQAGDRIALPRSIPSPSTGTLTSEMAALLGSLIGDGCTLPRHAIQYTTNELDLAEGVVESAKACFGEQVNPRINREHQWYQVYLPASRRLTHGVRNPIARWLDELRDIIPNAVWRRRVVPAMQLNDVTSRQLQRSLGMAYMGTGLCRQNISRERAARLSRAFVERGDSRLSILAASDVYWDRVMSIQPDGEEYVYDITVPGPHNFVANEMVSHNSIEQDADVVIFLHRERVLQSKDRDDTTGVQTELLVAKQRNGPIGKADLVFIPGYAKFESLSKGAEA